MWTTVEWKKVFDENERKDLMELCKVDNIWKEDMMLERIEILQFSSVQFIKNKVILQRMW